MRHIQTIGQLGEVVGFDVGTLSDEVRESAERVFDEVFERGYQAGHRDGVQGILNAGYATVDL